MKTENEIDVQCKIVADLLKQKNSDYGNAALASPILAPGLDAKMGIVVRLGDKIQRLLHLANNAAPMNAYFESFDDTILDIAGYCILFLIAKRQELTKDTDNE